MASPQLLKNMEQAMQVELKMGCFDTAVMGGFSNFILKTARSIRDGQANEWVDEQVKAIMANLIQSFANYPELSRAERRNLVTKAADITKQVLAATKNQAPAEKLPPAAKKPLVAKQSNLEKQPPLVKQPPVEKQSPVEKKAPAAKAARQLAELPLQYLKNIGPKRAQLLYKMGIYNAMDLLYHFPRRYEDRSNLKPFSRLNHGEVETARGTVLGVQDIKPRRGLTITKAALRDGTSTGYAVWFNQPFVKKQFKIGDELIITGKVDRKFGAVQVAVADFEVNDDTDDPTHVGRIVPVYPTTEGMPVKVLRTIIKGLLDQDLQALEDPLPTTLIDRFGFPGLHTALQNIHFPDTVDEAEQARHRLAFEELLVLQIGLAKIKSTQHGLVKGISHKKSGPLMERFSSSLPFPFTNAQKRVTRDIFKDMEGPHPMNRLLQGDVGSGKTVVAAAALVKAVESGYQGVLMAPTEILAEQHYAGLRELFDPLEVKVVLLTGSTPKKEREALLQDIAEGRVDVIIGTHALIQDEVDFHRLGVAVTDEQHRFGVRQRATLQKKGQAPDVLVMTATPIPRTLAMTVYGDLDVSVIDELPPGRQPIKTMWVTEGKRQKMYEFIRKQVREGRQTYYVCPLVEESEKLDVEAAIEMAERLATQVFPDLRIGLLHGRVKAADKERVMQAFRQGELDILVATTVIEVGVNVPNATVMVIEDAERFGLAQLHQLRGRVGRGSHQSYCLLLSDPKTDEGKARMQIMQAYSDGFKIAEEDLKLRGPGDFFGTRQSGLPDLKVADILKDVKLLERARQTAMEIITRDVNLELPEHQLLKKLVVERFKNKYQFINIS